VLDRQDDGGGAADRPVAADDLALAPLEVGERLAVRSLGLAARRAGAGGVELALPDVVRPDELGEARGGLDRLRGVLDLFGKLNCGGIRHGRTSLVERRSNAVDQ
jgi:hypothetical protein